MGLKFSNNAEVYERNTTTNIDPEMDKWILGPSKKYLQEQDKKKKEKEDLLNEKVLLEVNKFKEDLRYAYTQKGEQCIKYTNLYTFSTIPDHSIISKALKVMVTQDSRIKIPKNNYDKYDGYHDFIICFEKQ